MLLVNLLLRSVVVVLFVFVYLLPVVPLFVSQLRSLLLWDLPVEALLVAVLVLVLGSSKGRR